MMFIIFHVTQNRPAKFIAPSLVPKGIDFIVYFILSQLTRLKVLSEIRPLVMMKSLACVFPLWFLTTIDIKPRIFRGPTMQCQT